MRNESLKTINKYGKEIVLPPTGTTGPVQRIISILKTMGVDCVPEFKFDVTGYRRQAFDVAVMKEGKPVLLIEYDGPAHYDVEFYMRTGVRVSRCYAHVVKAQISEAKKALTANHFGVPVLRVNDKHLSKPQNLRCLLKAYVSICLDGVTTSNDEVVMVDMLDKYGWDFPFVPCSNPNKEELEAYERHKARYPNNEEE